MEHEKKITIDVVLLLPKEVDSLCKELNDSSDKEGYVSFRDGYNPHLTLGMGSLYLKDLKTFKNELKSVVNNLKFPEVGITSLGSGRYDYFDIEVNPALKNFHVAVFDLILKYNAGAVVRENFFQMNDSKSLIDWVDNFKTNSAYDNYHPHITLGVGITKPIIEFPIVFKPVSVGLFHLGVHGTCKKLLAEFK